MYNICENRCYYSLLFLKGCISLYNNYQFKQYYELVLLFFYLLLIKHTNHNANRLKLDFLLTPAELTVNFRIITG